MKPPARDVNDAADLGRALRRGDIVLRLPVIPADAQARLEKRLNFWRNVCGCQIGALAFLVTLGIRIPAMLRLPEWTLGAFAGEAAIALAAGIGGKLLALAGAQALLVIEVAMLKSRARRITPHAMER